MFQYGGAHRSAVFLSPETDRQYKPGGTWHDGGDDAAVFGGHV